jgi:hypothetical protein
VLAHADPGSYAAHATLQGRLALPAWGGPSLAATRVDFVAPAPFHVSGLPWFGVLVETSLADVRRLPDPPPALASLLEDARDLEGRLTARLALLARPETVARLSTAARAVGEAPPFPALLANRPWATAALDLAGYDVDSLAVGEAWEVAAARP